MRRTFRSTLIPFSGSSRPRSLVSSLGSIAVAALSLRVPERNVLESKLKGLDMDMGQRSDTGARRRGRRGRGLNIHISDVANVDMRGKDIKGRDVEILEDKFDLVTLVLGSDFFLQVSVRQNKTIRKY